MDGNRARAVARSPFAWYGEREATWSGGNAIRLLRGGDTLFPAMCAAIAAARRDVWLATYIYDEDASGEAVSRALLAAAARGVRVRVVVDGFGCLHSQAALRARFEPAGVGFAVFRPMHGWWSWLQPSHLRRLHQKLCAIDGEHGFVGGINLIDDRHDLHHGWGDAPRLDYAVELRGPVVAPVLHTLRAVWTRAAWGRDWRDRVRAVAKSGRPVQRARGLLQRIGIGSAPANGASGDALAPARLAFLVRDNLRQRRAIEHSYVAAIRQARERIDIVSAYFYPGRAFLRALRAAARRGVQVRLLLQGKPDYRVAQLAAQALYDELLARGVRVFEYMPAFLHAKVARVDDRWATVGSSNIDPLSLLLNLEANVVVDDPGFVAQLAAELERDFAAAREITAPLPLAGWRRWLRRGFVASIARLYLRAAGATGRY
ncbi:MAG TPA: cardiolipin synthase ClsB [Methylibium sp.]|nr:cardiolipin synthase ClsB [Methylibium sp.]